MTLAPSMLFTQRAMPSVMMHSAMKSSTCCQTNEMSLSFLVIFPFIVRTGYRRKGSRWLSSSAFGSAPLIRQSTSPLRNSMRVGTD